jgi:ADP-ribose pyrophosphatase
MKYPITPMLAVGGVIREQGRFLLVKRNNPPSQGQWAIPGGRVELGETLAQAVERELLEETGLIVRCGELLTHLEVIEGDFVGRVRFHYLILDFWAEWVSGSPRAGDDVLEVGWFSRQDLEQDDVSATTRDLLRSL